MEIFESQRKALDECLSKLPDKQRVLVEEGFEDSTAALVASVPLEPGTWRGDHAEIVGEENGVKPATGRKMLRFLREGYDAKAKSEGGHIADIYRLIDVREFQAEFVDDRSVVRVSANVNAIPFIDDEKYGCAISVYALNLETVPDRAGKIGTSLTNESTAMARSIRTKLAPDASIWQRLSTELRLPSSTVYLVIRLHVSQSFDPQTNQATFTVSYADNISVSLTRGISIP